MARPVLRARGSQWTHDGVQYDLPTHVSHRSHKHRFRTVLGKAEGSSAEWHGHITAVSVAPEYRRLSLARGMVNRLELVSDEQYKGFFVDLYVRCNNALAITMYEGFGYSVYRRVREYYGSLGVGKGGKDEEDAFGEFDFMAVVCIVLNHRQTCVNPFRGIR